MLTNGYFNSQDYILKYKSDNAYVPLYSLYLPNKTTDVSYASNVESSPQVKQLVDKLKDSKLKNFIPYYKTFFSWGDWNSFEQCKINLDLQLSRINDYIESNDIDDGIYNYRGSIRHLYAKNRLLSRIDNYNIEPCLYGLYTRHNSYKYILTNLFACSYNQNKLVPIFTMVVKKEYVEYVKACHLLGEQPKSLAFEFWITKGFDSKDTKEPYLRTHVYRKHIKKLLIEKHIPIIEKDNWFEDLYNINKQPIFKTLRDRKEWLNNISYEFTKHLNPYVEEDTSFCVADNIESISVDESQYLNTDTVAF